MAYARGVRNLALLLGLLILLPAVPVAAQDKDTFAADLDRCRELVRKRSWKKGRAAYEALFTQYEGDRRVVADAASIERDLQLCIFNLGRRLPDGETLFGTNVVKFSVSNRRIDMVFPQGLKDDPWEALRSGFRMLPMRFTNSVVVTVPASGSKTRFSDKSTHSNEDQVQVRVILALNTERSGGYLAAPPWTFQSDSDSTNFRLYDLGPTPPKLLKRALCANVAETPTPRMITVQGGGGTSDDEQPQHSAGGDPGAEGGRA